MFLQGGGESMKDDEIGNIWNFVKRIWSLLFVPVVCRWLDEVVMVIGDEWCFVQKYT